MNEATFKLEDELYGRFRDLVQTQSGLYFPDKKRRELELALSKALADAPGGISGAEGYYRYLATAVTPTARQEVARFINRLTIRETHLFRDSAQFDALAMEVLPALIAEKREVAAKAGTSPQLRLWSAGCSTGEEAYSLAILLRELLPDIARWHICILATDINEDLLARARQAIYPNWSFRESRAQTLRPRYFRPHHNGGRDSYQLCEEMRQMVTFAHHNLAVADYPAVHNNTTSMDLILCRNVTIYFAPETTRQIVGRFHQSLVEGGWLVVGHSEPSATTYSTFAGHIIQGTLLYQKQNDRGKIPFEPAKASTPEWTL
jgi:chemotaxis protein methyltransferase CheR